jgi:hypothetical protein
MVCEKRASASKIEMREHRQTPDIMVTSSAYFVFLTLKENKIAKRLQKLVLLQGNNIVAQDLNEGKRLCPHLLFNRS